MRAASHSPNKARSGFPAIGSRPVQLGIAVRRKPAIAAPHETEQHFMAVPGDRIEPCRQVEKSRQRAEPQASAMMPHMAAPKKNGLNPPRRKGVRGRHAPLAQRKHLLAARDRLRSDSGAVGPRSTGMICLEKACHHGNVNSRSKMIVSSNELSSTAETECSCPRSRDRASLPPTVRSARRR